MCELGQVQDAFGNTQSKDRGNRHVVVVHRLELEPWHVVV